jgi:hypothetical protein
MSDDEARTSLARDEIVNIADTFDFTYWTIKFACTPVRLRAAITKVGVSARAVELELKRSG